MFIQARKCSTWLTYPILNCNSNKAVIIRVDDFAHVRSSIASTIATSMDPNEYWELSASLGVWSIHIEEQAILAARRR